MRNNGRARGVLPSRWENDTRQALLSAAISCCCTALFALYHGYLGLRYGSVWHGSIGVFYLLLMAIRGMILLTEKGHGTYLPGERDRRRRRTFFLSSLLLLGLDLALILPISMMAVLDKPVSMGLIPAIAMAAYTTWKITMATIHLLRQRRGPRGNLLVAQLRTVSFIDALVAILTLQNTLIMVNRSTADKNAMLPLSTVSSGIIYAVMVTVTLGTLLKGLGEQRRCPAKRPSGEET